MTSENCHRRVKAWAKALSDACFALQITHFGGKYSIERMLALEEYTRKTSLPRVLLVIIGTPLPTIILVLCQESIPLQNPSDSWSVNYGFWIRMVALAIGEVCGTSIQTGCLLDGFSLSPTKMVIFCICVAIGNTAASMLVAAYWVFPIPFVNFLLSPVLVAFSVGTFRLLAGRERCRQILSQRGQLYQWFKYLSVQMVMVLIYPAYQALFDAASSTKFEVPVLFLLPVLKLVLKNMLTFTLLHKEDMIPEQVIFSVDFFDAFYLAMCMKNVSSIVTVIAIMAVDLVQTCIEMQEVHQRTRSILKRLHRALGTTSEGRHLLANVRLLCSRIEEILHRQPCTGFQVRSCISHKISPEGEIFLKNMAFHRGIDSKENTFNLSRSIIHEAARKLSLVSFSDRLSRGVSRSLSFQTKVAAAPVTFASTVLPKSSSDKQRAVKESLDNNLSILRESLEVLFTSECIVLTEFLESIVPVLYANFALVMVHFPSARYHAEMSGVSIENVHNTLQNVFIYAALEMVSFVILALVMWRNCGIHALYQLAFVMETHATLVQPKLVLWVLTTLTYRVTHFGVDFSFKFDWIRSS